MKPWRPYWKTLDAMIDALVATRRTAPFHDLSYASDWIANLTFRQLQECDMEITTWLRFRSHLGDPAPFHAAGSDWLCWQMILRAECGLSLCRNRFFKRRNFDWSQPPDAIYRHLLIELWRTDAIFWASSAFANGGVDRRREIAKRLGSAVRGIAPERN